MRYLLQAVVALALLVGLPFVMEPPETTQGLILTAIAGLVLAAVLGMGVINFIRHRRRPFPDSVLPPGHKGEKHTVIETRR